MTLPSGLTEADVERAAKAIAVRLGEGVHYGAPAFIEAAQLALTAALAGRVVVPAEITDAMRLATWLDQAKHVGATDPEADTLAARRMNDQQREMDRSAYRAMLAAAVEGDA